MKKFFFPLDTVLRYKEQVLDSLKAEHARILAKIRECENAIDELEHEHRQIGRASCRERVLAGV